VTCLQRPIATGHKRIINLSGRVNEMPQWCEYGWRFARFILRLILILAALQRGISIGFEQSREVIVHQHHYHHHKHHKHF